MSPLIYLFPVAGVATIWLFNHLASRVEAQVAASQGWPQATGTVTYSRVRVSKSTYYPSVKYDYVVSGQSYSSGRYAFGSWKGTRSQVHAVIDGLPEGGKVPVYYDPHNPKMAVLARVGQAKTYRIVGWALGGGLILVSVIALLAAPR